MKYLVASRSSKLAIMQTELVLTDLKKLFSRDEFQILPVKTKGDINKHPLFATDQKGLFEKEVDDLVLNGTADFGVHSLKDVPSDLHPELIIASIPNRAEPNDVLVGKRNMKLKNLPNGCKVGTSSLRRRVQILQKNPNVEVIPIRGNVETRISKSLHGIFDAVVLAHAGLTRLGLQDVIVERFSISEFLPAPGQGAMAVICRKDDRSLVTLLKKIEHLPSRLSVETERAFIAGINSGCRFPVGALATYDTPSNTIRLRAKAFSVDGKKTLRIMMNGMATRREEIGYAAAKRFRKNGIEKLASEWRETLNSWFKI